MIKKNTLFWGINFVNHTLFFFVNKPYNDIPIQRNMKKSILLLVLFAGVATFVSGQSLRKTEKIDADQVPVAIRAAFENDFGKVPEGGHWLANFTVEQDGTRSVAKPLSYIYRNKSEKIEVRYTADGKLDFVKRHRKKQQIK